MVESSSALLAMAVYRGNILCLVHENLLYYFHAEHRSPKYGVLVLVGVLNIMEPSERQVPGHNEQQKGKLLSLHYVCSHDCREKLRNIL